MFLLAHPFGYIAIHKKMEPKKIVYSIMQFAENATHWDDKEQAGKWVDFFLKNNIEVHLVELTDKEIKVEHEQALNEMQAWLCDQTTNDLITA